MKKILQTLGLSLVGVAMQAQITATDSIVIHPSCGANNGWAYVYASGGTQPYTYIWSPSVTLLSDNESNSLSAGTYTVIVKDATNASDTVVFTLNTNMSAITTFPIYAKCADGFGGLQNGYISSYLSYGTAPYSYQWSSSNSSGGQGNTADSVLITNLDVGTYAITITDAIGCSAITTVDISYCDTTTLDTLGLGGYITYDCNPIITIPPYATAYIFGGKQPYSYLWSTGETSAMKSGIADGNTYTLTVTDAAGASMVTFTTIYCNNDSTIWIPTLGAYTNYSCYSDTMAYIVAYDGTAPYTYAWSSNGTVGNDQYIYPVIGNSTYQISVTDATGATFSTSFYAYDCDSLGWNDSIYNNPLSAWAYSYCYDYYYDTISGGTTGAWAYGGAYPYTYSWSNGQSGEYLYNAANGTYVVTVTDAVGATTTATVDVNCSNSTPSCDASFFTYTDSIDPSIVYLINTSVGQNISVDFGDGTYVNNDSTFAHVYANPGTYNICVYAWGNGCIDTLCANLTVAKTTPVRQVKVIRPVINAQTTGINEAKDKITNVNVYPNPANTTTTIAYDLKEASNTTINIVDLVGKNVMNINLGNQQAGNYVKEIPTAELANGTYFVQLTTNTTVKNIKLMVNH